MKHIGKQKPVSKSWNSTILAIALLLGIAFVTTSCGAANAQDNQWLDAPIPNLKLRQGIQTDWRESEQITKDVSNRYVLNDTMTIGVVYSAPPESDAPSNSLGYSIPPGPGSALYFAEDGSDTATARIDIPYRDVSPETDILMMHINMSELFPYGFTGQMWGVIVEMPWQDQQIEEWHGKRIDVIYVPDKE